MFRYSILKERRVYYTDRSYPYLMPREKSIDIDTLLDFKFAEIVLRERGANR